MEGRVPGRPVTRTLDWVVRHLDWIDPLILGAAIVLAVLDQQSILAAMMGMAFGYRMARIRRR